MIDIYCCIYSNYSIIVRYSVCKIVSRCDQFWTYVFIVFVKSHYVSDNLKLPKTVNIFTSKLSELKSWWIGSFFHSFQWTRFQQYNEYEYFPFNLVWANVEFEHHFFHYKYVSYIVINLFLKSILLINFVFNLVYKMYILHLNSSIINCITISFVVISVVIFSVVLNFKWILLLHKYGDFK